MENTNTQVRGVRVYDVLNALCSSSMRRMQKVGLVFMAPYTKKNGDVVIKVRGKGKEQIEIGISSEFAGKDVTEFVEYVTAEVTKYLGYDEGGH